MNLRNYPRRKYAIDQFTQPHVTELAGERFHFVMDDGHDYWLAFTGEDSVEWHWDGDAAKHATCFCLKGDDTTYLVSYELDEFLGTPDREEHFFIIDLEQRLVTFCRCKLGENPRFPLLISSKYIFGAIEVPGLPLPLKRHAFTSDLLGTRAEWHWNTGMATRHSYFSTAFYRITVPGATYGKADRGIPDRGGPLLQELPSTDEVAQYIKIKDKLYLFSLVEEIMERTLCDRNPPFRSNDMKFLQNYDRMVHVGRTFGTVKVGGADDPSTELRPCHIRFGAFGTRPELDEVFLNAPNPYAP